MLVVLPVLTAVRVAQEISAGTILRLDASLIGSLSVVDPWTRANLYSATRMVS